MRRLLLSSLILIITFITIQCASCSQNIPSEALAKLSEYIKVSLQTPKINAQILKFFHPDAILLGGDVFDIIVTPDSDSEVWSFGSTNIVFEDRNLQKPGKEELLKVVVKFQTIARVKVTNKLIFNKTNESFQRTFYLSKLKDQWYIMDMSQPNLNVLSKEATLAYTEKLAQRSGNQIYYQLIDKLKEL